MRRIQIDCVKLKDQNEPSMIASLLSLEDKHIHSWEELNKAMLELQENILIEVHHASSDDKELLDCLESVQQKSDTVFLARGPQ